jgi:AraC family transcriptional regulator of adaptative response / DNA-3-methyladenine glycosylase II
MSDSRQQYAHPPGTLVVVIEDFERCYRAVQSKDARFDGWFFTAVTSTGIYCRPSCPAMTPQPSNVRFYASAAGAQLAGFRACKRCRPDATPGSPEWDVRADAVARAMRLIADGVVDREGVPGLAHRLGYSTRQVERLLTAEVGAGPIALARAQRSQSARVLIETTSLPMGEIAFAAGFASVRQFNDTVRGVFALSPTDLRRRNGRPTATSHTGQTIRLRLAVREPFWPDNTIGHLAGTAVPGCEELRDGWYRRTLRLAHGPGIVALRPAPDHVACDLTLSDLRDLTAAVTRCRRMLDLDADPVAVGEILGADELLGPVVRKSPGQRIPRTVDEAELAVRVVIGQQISTIAARGHAARLVRALGTPVEDRTGELTHLFPTSDQLAEADPSLLRMPERRKETIRVLTRALADGAIDLGPGADRAEARRQLGAIAGIGEWSVELIAMRSLGDPDAFPRGDLGVRLAAASLGLPDKPGPLLEHARAWAPWRSYAVQYLWSVLDHPINNFATTTRENQQ